MMLGRVIRAVIFDLDGTLVNSLSGIATALNRVLHARGLPTHPQHTVRTFIGNGIVKLVERALPAGFTPEQTRHIAGDVSQDYASSWREGTTVYPEVTRVLGELLAQGVSIAVLSNKPDEFCREMTDYLFPEIAFATVTGHREGTPLKPDPAGALEVAHLMKVEPAEIAFVGDSTVDIATARRAGMIAVACSWGYHDLPALEAASPDHLIARIDDLPAMIRRETSRHAL